MRISKQKLHEFYVSKRANSIKGVFTPVPQTKEAVANAIMCAVNDYSEGKLTTNEMLHLIEYSTLNLASLNNKAKVSEVLASTIAKRLRDLPANNRAKVIQALTDHDNGHISDADLQEIYYHAMFDVASTVADKKATLAEAIERYRTGRLGDDDLQEVISSVTSTQVHV
ncbi:hypothetical protein ACO0K7_10155 [Undibacterium sp. Ji67W]|uniref:hypothetical protein n=1 Tax=Undibacterium sp. Ji67W TaxID=3413042 RepID=UPI003BF075B0